MKLGPAVCLASAFSVAVAGCSHSKAAEQRDHKTSIESNDQLAITTRDGNVVLALTKAKTVAMRLSDSLRQHVNGEVAREFGRDSSETAFGRWIQRTTANLVTKGMALELSIPLDEVEDVRYEDGEIRFEYRSHRKFKFDSFKRDGHSAMTDFESDDAERFVAAVRKQIGAKT
jgi:hypothetical protein